MAFPAAWCLELGVGEVAIREKGGGHFDPLKTKDEMIAEFGELEAQRRWAIHCLAGVHAQQRFRPKVFPDGGNDDSASAEKAKRSMVELTNGGDYDELTEQIREATNSLVGEHWARIERLANALLETSKIPGPDALRIIESALSRN